MTLSTIGDSGYTSASAVEIRSSCVPLMRTFGPMKHEMTLSLLLTNSPRKIGIIFWNGFISCAFWLAYFCFAETDCTIQYTSWLIKGCTPPLISFDSCYLPFFFNIPVRVWSWLARASSKSNNILLLVPSLFPQIYVYMTSKINKRLAVFLMRHV